jgi:hypothetical protein
LCSSLIFLIFVFKSSSSSSAASNFALIKNGLNLKLAHYYSLLKIHDWRYWI